MISYATLRDPMAGANKTERAYASHLDMQIIAGEVLSWAFEPIRLRLADGTFYTPDFMVVNRAQQIEIHETKGFMREAARVRLNVAAELHPFQFFLVKRDGSSWSRERV